MKIIELTKNVSVQLSDNLNYEERLLVERILAVSKLKKSGVTLQIISESVCKYFGCHFNEIVNGGRLKQHCLATKAICILYTQYELNYTMQEVATFLGRKSHAVVFNSMKYENKMRMKNYIIEIKKIIEQSIEQHVC